MVIFGSGEEAELAYLAIRALGMKLHGIVDPTQPNKPCLGTTIQDLPWLAEQKDIDLLLVSQSARLEGAFDEQYEDIRGCWDGVPILQIEI